MLKGQELSEAYASADIFVMPSETETLGDHMQLGLLLACQHCSVTAGAAFLRSRSFLAPYAPANLASAEFSGMRCELQLPALALQGLWLWRQWPAGCQWWLWQQGACWTSSHSQAPQVGRKPLSSANHSTTERASFSGALVCLPPVTQRASWSCTSTAGPAQHLQAA